MKFLAQFVVALGVAAMLTACGGGKVDVSSAKLSSTQADSASYAIGLFLSRELEGLNLDSLNYGLIAKGLQDGIEGVKGDTLMTLETANTALTNYMKSQSKVKSEKNKKDGKDFLEKNKAKTGITTTASGLQYEIMKAGTGAKPTAEDKVKVHYHGTLIDGTVFDSSVDRGEPVEFPVSGVISGWTEALQLMPVGSKWKVYIPAELGYGDRAAGKIEAGSTLIFEVELLDILKGEDAGVPTGK